jgi:type IV secretory pathway VirB3-like protein
MIRRDEDLDDTLIEATFTRPPMFFGLPRKLSSVLLCVGSMGMIEIDGIINTIVFEACVGVAWGACLPLVARDYWGFDIWLNALNLNFAALDVRQWGGVHLSSAPLQVHYFGMLPESETVDV